MRGGGQHLKFIASYCKYALGVDLNTSEIARKNNKYNKNIKIVEGDITTIKLNRKFDIVYSIGTLHHTNNPTKAFNNIKKFVKKGGKLIIWVYSWEGNFFNRILLEHTKKIIFSRLGEKKLWILSIIITAMAYIPVYSIYLLPLNFIPFYDYFKNFRKMDFGMNHLNIYDKLNAPRTFFIKRATIEKWFNKDEFTNIHVSHYKGVSWRTSGTKI